MPENPPSFKSGEQKKILLWQKKTLTQISTSIFTRSDLQVLSNFNEKSTNQVEPCNNRRAP